MMRRESINMQLNELLKKEENKLASGGERAPIIGAVAGGHWNLRLVWLHKFVCPGPGGTRISNIHCSRVRLAGTGHRNWCTRRGGVSGARYKRCFGNRGSIVRRAKHFFYRCLCSFRKR